MEKIDFSNLDIDKSLPLISISAVLDSLEHPFDQQGVAQKTHDKHFNNPQSEYYQMTVEQIIDKWSSKGAESRRYGSMLDDYIGTILTGTENDIKLFKMDNAYDYDERIHGLCDSFDHFYELMMSSGDVEFIDREKTVYLKVRIPNPYTDNFAFDGEYIDYYVKGRFDALFYNKRTHKWILIDWKSSGSIDKVPSKYTDNFLGPMFKYPELNYYRYTNQLHFYKKALLENYLPEGTKEEDIVVMIVNLPGKLIKESGKDYMTHLAGMKYDPTLIDNILKFGITRNLLTAKKKTEETKEEVIIEQSDNIENIF